jgi:hypothetical protein
MVRMADHVCRNCKAPLDGDTRRRYCSTKCKKEFNYNVSTGKSTAPEVRSVPEYVKNARALAERKLADMTVLDDEVREVMREEVRKHITERVKDRVIGATDLMGEMLPLAMARLYEDLESQDWARYSRAAAIVMRYTMMIANQDADGADLGRITVVHEIPGQDPVEFVLPDTELGHEVAHQIQKRLPATVDSDTIYDPDNPEDFEANWEQCYKCHERRHPDSLRVHDDHRWICVTCRYKHDAEMSKAEVPLGGNDEALYHPPSQV